MLKQMSAWGGWAREGVTVSKLNTLQTRFLTVIFIFSTDAATVTKSGTKIDTMLVSHLGCADTPATVTADRSAPGGKNRLYIERSSEAL